VRLGELSQGTAPQHISKQNNARIFPMNDRPAFVMSIDTRAVYDRLKAAGVDEMVSFRALGEALGRKVAGDDPSVQSAVRKMLSEGYLFDNVRGEGYKRLNDVEVVQTAEREREGIRRKARRAVKKLSCVQNFEKLPNDLKVKHNAAISGFGAIAQMLTAGNMKKLEGKVEAAQQQLPLAKTLEAFRG
jgi:hypothetical protein